MSSQILAIAMQMIERKRLLRFVEEFNTASPAVLSQVARKIAASDRLMHLNRRALADGRHNQGYPQSFPQSPCASTFASLRLCASALKKDASSPSKKGHRS
jgi:hypothetical protein